jgi:phosphatidylserine decarboxylase
MSADRNNLIDTITGMFVPVHRDGHKFIFAAAIVTLLLFLIVPPLGWVGAIITAWCAYFFRDPERVTPLRDGLVVSGADGRIVAIEEVIPPREIVLGEARWTRISVFLSIFDVHIVRAPLAGRIARSVYVPGQFLNAELDKASEDNERRTFVIETASGEKIAMAMIAGLVARRIVTFVEEGVSVAAGQRVGLIRFGSRVDVYLPQGAQPLVAIGQRAIGGETVFADLTSAEAARAFRTD